MFHEDILSAIRQFYSRMLEAGEYNSIELKNFLEPVFERAGYRDESESHEILIVHDAGVGDFTLLSPSLRAIRQKFSDARITLVCSSINKSLAECCPYVDSIFCNEKSFEFEDFPSLFDWQIGFAEKLLPYRFDLAICFCHQIGGYLLAYLSGAKIIASYIGPSLCDSRRFPLGNVVKLINKPIEIKKSRPHVLDRYIGIAEGILDHSIEDLSLEIWYTPRCRKIATEVLRAHGFFDQPIFAIVLGGTSATKYYPPEKYSQLAKKILEKIPDARFVILGGARDVESGRIFSESLKNPERVLDLSGKTSYSETAAILDLCSMYIGNDTGAMHVAAAVDLPILAPFCYPADKPLNDASVIQMYYPRGVPAVLIQPRQSLSDCVDSHEPFFGCQAFNQPHCITQIEVETMLEGFNLLLEMVRNNDRETKLVF